MKVYASLACLAGTLVASLARAELSSAISTREPDVAASGCKLLASPPASSTCGQKGGTGRTGPSSQQTLSLAGCARLCSDENENRGSGYYFAICFAFTYDSSTRLCSLYTSPATFIANATSTVAYYNPNCFDCPTACAESVPLHGNLFDNPGFNLSQKLGPWNPSSGGASTEIVPFKGGENAVMYSFTSTDTTASLGQGRGLCDNIDYLLSFDVKVDRNGPASRKAGTFDVSWSLGDCSTSFTFTQPDNDFGQWRKLQCSLRRTVTTQILPLLDNFKVEFGRNDPSASIKYTATFANPQLTRIPPNSIKIKGPSLVRNGGFESKQLKPWVLKARTEEQGFYYTGPVVHCNATADNPLGGQFVSFPSPGFPTQSGSASKFAFQFCGAPAEIVYYPYESEAFLVMSQRIPMATSKNKVYVLTIDLQGFNIIPPGITYGRTSFVPYTFIYDNDIPETRMLLQRIFTGTGDANTTLSMTFYDHHVVLPIPELRLILDNISIRELDG